AMGSDAALLHRSYVADKSRFAPAREHAREALEGCARARGLTVDELADRTVPDLDLSPDGTTSLDFGPRALRVTFDETLKPLVLGDDGARLPQMPRGIKTDDAAKVKLAQARFKALKADAAEIAASLLRRLESAMVRGRSWAAPDFRAHVLAHPLVAHLARRLVWQDDRATFRVAEDGTFASELDAEYTLH